METRASLDGQHGVEDSSKIASNVLGLVGNYKLPLQPKLAKQSYSERWISDDLLSLFHLTIPKPYCPFWGEFCLLVCLVTFYLLICLVWFFSMQKY